MLLDADKIRRLRVERGWTQEQLAEVANLSARTIQRIEKTGVASLESCNAIAAVFEQPRQDLLLQGGVRPARTEIRVRHVIIVAAVTFLLGIGIGSLV